MSEVLRGTDPKGERFGVTLRSWEIQMFPAFYPDDHPKAGEQIIHWYADAWHYDPEKNHGLRVEKFQVIRTLDADGCIELREKDHAGVLGKEFASGYKVGDTTYRFATRESAAEAGIALLREKFGEGCLVLEGDHYEHDNPDADILGRT